MINISEITIREIQDRLRRRELTVRELVQEYIDRIHKYDEGENGLNSVLEINPEALAIAEELDRQGFREDKLLFGIPVLLKDNIATDDHLHTSAGSVVLADSYTHYDADLVKSLRKSGAVILGKTNMTEFANYMTEHMPNGYSSRGGQVKNPYDREKDPSGSSSGSAVAAAANLCAASIGSDTCYSIVAPGIANGIVGLRPTTGVISQKGIVPISFSLDTAGPFTRTVEDAAIMFAALTDTPVIKGEDEGLEGKVIGIYEYMLEELTEEEINLTREAARRLEEAGAVVKNITLPDTPYIMDVMKYEFKYSMNEYLKTLPKDYPVKTLKDIIEYNKQHAKKALKYGQTLLIDAEENASGRLDEEAYKDIMKDRQVKIREAREQLKQADVCIIMNGTSILQYAELPVITIPCGLKKDGMPFVLHITAANDEQLIKIAYSVEKAIGKRVAPKGV